jgi:hypothetical protein
MECLLAAEMFMFFISFNFEFERGSEAHRRKIMMLTSDLWSIIESVPAKLYQPWGCPTEVTVQVI